MLIRDDIAEYINNDIEAVKKLDAYFKSHKHLWKSNNWRKMHGYPLRRETKTHLYRRRSRRLFRRISRLTQVKPIKRRRFK